MNVACHSGLGGSKGGLAETYKSSRQCSLASSEGLCQGRLRSTGGCYVVKTVG